MPVRSGNGAAECLAGRDPCRGHRGHCRDACDPARRARERLVGSIEGSTVGLRALPHDAGPGLGPCAGRCDHRIRDCGCRCTQCLGAVRDSGIRGTRNRATAARCHGRLAVSQQFRNRLAHDGAGHACSTHVRRIGLAACWRNRLRRMAVRTLGIHDIPDFAGGLQPAVAVRTGPAADGRVHASRSRRRRLCIPRAGWRGRRNHQHAYRPRVLPEAPWHRSGQVP